MFSIVLAVASLLVFGLVAQKALASPPREFSSLHAAARAGHLGAKLTLGQMYLSGTGIGQTVRCDLAKAYLEEVAISGSNTARYLMGKFFSQSACPHDLTKAFSWFNLAAQDGHSASLAMVGFMYEAGSAVPQSQERARTYFERAFERDNADGELTRLGDRDVAYALGSMMLFGIGGKKNPRLGMSLLSRAAALGSPNAQALLNQVADRHSEIASNERQAFWGGLLLGSTVILFSLYFRNQFRQELNISIEAENSGLISKLPPKIQAGILNSLPGEFNEILIECLPLELVAELAKHDDPRRAPLICQHIPSDVQAQMLASLSEDNFSRLLKSIPRHERQGIRLFSDSTKRRANLRLISREKAPATFSAEK